MIDALLNDKRYDIEFNGHLSNHNKHAVIALWKLGADHDTIRNYYDTYANETPYGFALEPPRVPMVSITEANWKNYLGKRTSFWSYCDFYQCQVQQKGLKAVLQEFLPQLLPGWVGALTHGAIHMGWALDAANEWMCIEGLAYMSYVYVDMQPQRCFQDTRTESSTKMPLDSLLDIAHYWQDHQATLPCWIESLIEENMRTNQAGIHGELMRSGLQHRIAVMFSHGHQQMYMRPQWIDQLSLEDIWQQLHYLVALVYMAYKGDFFILHLLTSLHAMEHMALHLHTNVQKECVHLYWMGLIGLMFAKAQVLEPQTLNALNGKYQSQYDREPLDEQDPLSWSAIIARAKQEVEEHNPKLVYVLKRMWLLSGKRSIFRLAASEFTQTPILPKSFEKPPVYEAV